MAETFLALLTAHLLGDFVIQTDWVLKNKRKKLVLLLHVTTICIASLAMLRSFHWQIVITVFVTHLFFDLLKTKASKDSTGPFLIDQIAHISVAAILAVVFPDTSANGWWPVSIPEWLPWFHSGLCLLSGVILIVPAGGILIGKLTEPIREEIKESKIIVDGSDPHSPYDNTGDHLTEGLSNGGRYIGWLERFLTMLLILIAQPTGIGFLIAAKSILRFGEIKESKHRKLTEYIIIGTFLSFGWALLITVLMQKGIDHWTPMEESRPLKVILESPVSSRL